jgi:hypothetical protein
VFKLLEMEPDKPDKIVGKIGRAILTRTENGKRFDDTRFIPDEADPF